MPVRVSCPHCRTPCQVAEQHLGVPVKCGRCGRTFTTRIESPAIGPPARLDIGMAAAPKRGRQRNEDRFLVQHVVRCNLEERQELAVLVLAEGSAVLPAAAAALTPLLGDVLNGVGKGVEAAAEKIAGACANLSPNIAIVVIWNGQVSISGVGDSPIYHHSGGRLTRLKRGPMKLSAGDCLVIAGHLPLDEAALQTEIAACASSALELAERVVERAGGESGPIVVVRGY